MTKKQYSNWNVNVGTVEEIESDDHFSVILQKRRPGLPESPRR
jgi:hypothetical protein